MPEQIKQHFGDQDKYQLNTTKMIWIYQSMVIIHPDVLILVIH